MELTRERLLKIQQWRETYGAGHNVILPAEEAEELARIALASLEDYPAEIDERASFDAWNNEDNLPIAGVGAKNAAWLAWQARSQVASLPSPAPVVSAEIRNGFKAEAMAELLKDAHDYAPLTAEQWETLVNNWQQTFMGLSGEGDSCRAAMLHTPSTSKGE